MIQTCILCFPCLLCAAYSTNRCSPYSSLDRSPIEDKPYPRHRIVELCRSQDIRSVLGRLHDRGYHSPAEKRWLFHRIRHHLTRSRQKTKGKLYILKKRTYVDCLSKRSNRWSLHLSRALGYKKGILRMEEGLWALETIK